MSDLAKSHLEHLVAALAGARRLRWYQKFFRTQACRDARNQLQAVLDEYNSIKDKLVPEDLVQLLPVIVQVSVEKLFLTVLTR